VAELVDERGEVVAVDDLPSRTLRQREIVADLGVRQDDDVVPAQPTLSRASVCFNDGHSRNIVLWQLLCRSFRLSARIARISFFNPA
jgi:hypothetical protein